MRNSIQAGGLSAILSRTARILCASAVMAVGFSGQVAADDKPILEYLYEWGEPGTGTAKFRALRGIVAYDRKESDDRTIVVVADGGRDLLRSYTWNMMFIDKWGSTGEGEGQFREPRGVDIDPDGNLVVVDSYNHRVQKTVVGTKTFLERPGVSIMAFGSRGKENGQFETPTGVAVSPTGEIFVVDTENHRVQKFDSAGKFISTWGTRGSGKDNLDRPTHAALSASGKLYVSDSGNHRIQVFDTDGKHLSSFGSIGTEIGQFAEPKGLAVDTSGNVWVVDRRNHRLQKFDADGKPMGVFGGQGPGKGKFSFPEDMTFDSSNRLYVTDGMNGRIQVLKPI